MKGYYWKNYNIKIPDYLNVFEDILEDNLMGKLPQHFSVSIFLDQTFWGLESLYSYLYQNQFILKLYKDYISKERFKKTPQMLYLLVNVQIERSSKNLLRRMTLYTVEKNMCRLRESINWSKIFEKYLSEDFISTLFYLFYYQSDFQLFGCKLYTRIDLKVAFVERIFWLCLLFEKGWYEWWSREHVHNNFQYYFNAKMNWKFSFGSHYFVTQLGWGVIVKDNYVKSKLGPSYFNQLKKLKNILTNKVEIHNVLKFKLGWIDLLGIFLKKFLNHFRMALEIFISLKTLIILLIFGGYRAYILKDHYSLIEKRYYIFILKWLFWHKWFAWL